MAQEKKGTVKTQADSKTVKKTAAKTASTAKKEPKKSFFVQWMGNSFSQDEIEKRVKKAWMKDFKKKAGDLKDMQIYVKVEENAAYYVINGEDNGRLELLSE